MQTAVAPIGNVHHLSRRPAPAEPTLANVLPGAMFLVGEDSRIVFAVLSHANLDASQDCERRWCVAVLSADPQRPVGSVQAFDASVAVRAVTLIHPALLHVQPARGGR